MEWGRKEMGVKMGLNGKPGEKKLIPFFPPQCCPEYFFLSPQPGFSPPLSSLLFLEDRDTKLAAALPIARAFTGVVVWVPADFLSNFALSIFCSWQVHKLRTVL